MLKLKPFKPKKIISTLLILVLLFSIFSSLFYFGINVNSVNTHREDHSPPITPGEPEPKPKADNSILQIKNPISNIPQDTDPEPMTISEEFPASQTTNELELFYEKSQTTRSDGSRSNGEFSNDLWIKRIALNYSGLFPWKFPGMSIPYYIVGEIGELSIFSITIENIGTLPVENHDDVSITINLTDYYGYSRWEQRDYIGHLPPGNERTVNFSWIPTYSNCFNLTCNLSYSKDQNNSNNINKVFHLYTKKWSDDLEDGVINDWSGDISPTAWHLTDTIEKDPNPAFHTNLSAFYHGIEFDGMPDDYGEKNDFDLITPEIDLRRFERGQPTFLNFKFYGNSTPNKDKFNIMGYKPSEDIWETINVEFTGGETLNNTNQPSWYFWQSGFYIGIPINSYIGELVRFKINWQSDLVAEQSTGFYLDDFFVYGIERPLPEYDVGIEDISITPSDVPIVVEDDFKISANITNYGAMLVSNFWVNISVKDLTGRTEETIPKGYHIENTIHPGNSKLVTWKILPSVSGIYIINISIDLKSDEITGNNFITSEAVEVYKYFNSFEVEDDAWVHDEGWVRNDEFNDPYPDQHSRWNAWYVDTNLINSTEMDFTSSLYSPIIDLDGAQNNLDYKVELRLGFKWYGEASNQEKIYFEYALDHSDNWQLFLLPDSSQSIILGSASDSWHVWDNLGTTDLFGHHVQFRWRFLLSGDLELKSEIGFYIDDFSLWLVQEQFGRPIISDCQVYPNSIINDSRDQAIITCRIENSFNDIAKVFIDIEPLGGDNDQLLFDDGTNDDTLANDNIYTLTITVPSSIPENEYILKITAEDGLGLFDNNYVKVSVLENSAPVITTHEPLEPSLIIYENEAPRFLIQALDFEDGNNLKYNWYLNSNKVENSSKNSFTFNTDFHGNYSAGSYELKVIVTDFGLPPKTAEFEWNLEVLNVLPDFEIREDDLFLSYPAVLVNETVDLEVLIHNLEPPREYNVTVHFIQMSTTTSIIDTVFSEYVVSVFPGKDLSNDAKIYLSVPWVANLSYNYLKVWVDPENTVFEVNETNNYAIIHINVSQPPSILEPDIPNNSTTKQKQVPYLFYLLTICVTITSIGLFFAIGTEYGNYRLLLLFTPLYSRVTGNKVLEHELRSKIYTYIRAHPGDHYRSIMAKLKIKNGTLVHHLARLEQEELIKSERDGYFKRFYPKDMRIPISDVGMYYPEGYPTFNIGEHQVSEIQLRIIKSIRKHPGLTQKEIAQRINESRRVVNYHIKLLEQHNLVRVIKSGRETQCYITDKFSKSS